MKRFKPSALKSVFVLLASLSSVLVSGCATLTTSPNTVMSKTGNGILTESPRQYRQHITLGGRLSLRYEQDGLERVLDGKFTWQQTPALTQIVLSTPFGQTLATIDINPTLATLIQNGQAPRSEANVDTLIAGTLGWPLPIAGLRDWLQGFATDRQNMPWVASAATKDTYLHTLDGWLLRYPVWQGDRPKRIDLQRLTSQAGNVNLRIVLDDWQEGPTTERGPG